ncbi:MAG: FumA C-terminus/TtdB family hydratase beta subunit [Oscillospiraceae bacterium]|nr:FumA C-terminus/TtdB family hydratase beta subunit [Oscillospiraceae bacterium]
MKKIYTNNIRECIEKIYAGDEVYMTGTLYTARDAAHKKLSEMLDLGIELPFEIRDSVIYYAGPTPAPKINPGNVAVGSCGPTTSKRMDLYTPKLLKSGLACMIGKGARSHEVCEAMKERGAVYLCAIGGAGAIYSKHIKSAKVIAFDELGCESVKELTVEDFPVYVAIDKSGNNIYDIK